MTQMLGKYNEESGHNHHNRTEIEMRCIECRHGEPGDFLHFGEIYDTHENREDIAGNDTDQNRNDGNKSAAQHGGKNRDHQGEHGDNNSRFIRHTLRFTDETRHTHGKRRKLQTDDGDNGTHRCRREKNINPGRPDFIDQERKDDERQTEADESALGVRIGHARRCRYRQHGRNKCKTRAQIGRQFPFANRQIQKRTNPVHQKTSRRIDIQKERNEDRRAEHCEQVLQTQWNRRQQR